MQTKKILLRLKAASAGAFERPAPLFKFVAAALVGPFILLTIGGSRSPTTCPGTSGPQCC